MGATWLVHSLTTTPFFAARAFLATFLIALACRFAPEIAPYVDLDTVKLLGSAPAWLMHDVTLVALGLLAALEFFATRNVDARALMNEIDPLLKAGFAFVTTYGLLQADLSPLQPALSGFDPMSLWAFVPATLVFFMATARARVLTALHEVDLDDDLGVQKLFVWLEDFWVAGGLLVAFLLPLLAVFVFASALVGLLALQRAVQWLDDRTREPCEGCDQLVHPTAPACGHCGTARLEPRAVGVFGQGRNQPAPELALHRRALVTRGRCSSCGERLTSRSADQLCGVCGTPAFAGQADFDDWLAGMDRKLPKAIGLSFVCGLVPLVGIIPGVIGFRLMVVSPLRRYMPRTVGCAARWGARMMNVILICLQPVPILGAVTLPLMCFVNYRLYRAMLTTGAARPAAFEGEAV